MRRVISSSLLAIALLVVAPVPSDAWRNGGAALLGAAGVVTGWQLKDSGR